MSYVLQTNQLTKTMGGKALVSNVNLHIKKGEIYGFLGPNGAGKTTVMKMITNLWKPDSGTIEIFGEVLTPKSYEVLKRMGSIIEFPTFYERLTGYENLKLHCEYMGYYHHGSIENALEMLELSDASQKQVRSYSLGMKERLGIARAMLCRPQLLILDEPTNGLDPAGMRQIRNLLNIQPYSLGNRDHCGHGGCNPSGPDGKRNQYGRYPGDEPGLYRTDGAANKTSGICPE